MSETGALVLTPFGAGWRFHDRRPKNPARMLTGRQVRDAQHLAGLLFPFCGMAHVAAFTRAVSPAAPPSALSHLERADALAAHVWRAALTWTAALQRSPAEALTASARRAALSLAHQTLDSEEARRLFGAAPAGGSDRDAALETLAACVEDVRPLCDSMEDAARHVPSARGRFKAMADLASRQMEELQALAPVRGALLPVADDAEGEGTAVTSRGPLTYRVRVAGGMVAACESVAPTDLAFAPGGAAEAALAGARSAQEAALITSAFDPCAPVVLDGGHA